MKELIEKYLGFDPRDKMFKSSVDSYAESGKVSGSLLNRIKEMFKEFEKDNKDQK